MPRSTPEIPNEIVEQIFAVLATTLITGARYASAYSTELKNGFAATPLTHKKLERFPWFLGHICSTWRCIFLSMTAEFWHSISIVSCHERTIDVVRFFLERDVTAPFSFYVASLGHNSSDPMRPIIELLVDHSMRWKTASFRLSAQELLPLLRTKNCLPLLQELHITSKEEEDMDFEELRNVFQNAPSLNTTKIDIVPRLEYNMLSFKVELYGLRLYVRRGHRTRMYSTYI